MMLYRFTFAFHDIEHSITDYVDLATVADVLVPNRWQAINDHHGESNQIILSHESYCVLQIYYWQLIKQTMSKRCWEVGNL